MKFPTHGNQIIVMPAIYITSLTKFPAANDLYMYGLYDLPGWISNKNTSFHAQS